MLSWANRFNIFCFLDNQDYSVQPHRYECLLGVGVSSETSLTSFNDVDLFLEKNKTWIFGHLSYELKTSIHQLGVDRQDPIGFPAFYFFVPKFFLQLNHHELIIHADDGNSVYKEIIQEKITTDAAFDGVSVQQKLSREDYLQKLELLLKHIVRGDCYEINFCQEFFAENAHVDPPELFEKLTAMSPNPFSALYKLDDRYLICASPERFLMKKGRQLISQPMKGTIKRDLTNQQEDERLKAELKASTKDQSENVMVVDMVRNDLSRVCEDASVQVNELFGVYTYPHVHQMISTISGELKKNVRFSEIIKSVFPMGSMTGAPKHRVMELIDLYESSARGIFSGSVGYISPEGDFDFNVVIRSIMYNSSTNYLSYKVGSGITFYSDPQKEWEECLLKGEAMRKVLENNEQEIRNKE